MSKVKTEINQFKSEFFKELGIPFLIIISICILNNAFIIFDFKSDKNFEIIVTMIGLLGVVAGFLVTSFSITIASLSNRLSNESETKKITQLNQYWDYLVGTFKYVLYSYVVVLCIFSLFLTIINTNFRYLNFVIPFVILVTFYLLYYSVKAVAIYLRNQFN